MLDTLEIRPARESDLPELVRIYNHYVSDTHVTFDIEPLGVEQRRPWFDTFSESGPHRLFVASEGEHLAGYASSGRFRPKPAYDRTAETTIYLAPDCTGRGLGPRLYGHLLDTLATETDVHLALGGIALPNPASIALHERFGFRPVGTFHEVGFKFGKHWDVRWYEKNLSDGGAQR